MQCASWALAAPRVWGQTDLGGITGTVVDPTGAAVPSAMIEVRNTDTGAVSRVGASVTGNFVVPVPAGTYEVSAGAPGSKRFVRPGIVVPVATTVRVDATLEVGATSESITITDAGTPLLKTESGELSHNLQTDTLDSLPVLQMLEIRLEH